MRALALALLLALLGLAGCGGDTGDHARCALGGGDWQCGPIGPNPGDNGCWCVRPGPSPQHHEREKPGGGARRRAHSEPE